MRPGLLLTGAAIAAIGVGVLAAALLLNSGYTTTHIDSDSGTNVGGHSSFALTLGGVNPSSTVVLAWASSQHLQVSVFASGSCPQGVRGPCPNGPALVNWWNNSGRWSYNGSITFPLILNFTNPNDTAASYSVTLVETYSPNTGANPSWIELLPLVGAAVLMAIGGLAVFLGLFLRSGVYSGPRPPVGPVDPEDDDDDLGDSGELDADDRSDEGPD